VEALRPAVDAVRNTKVAMAVQSEIKPSTLLTSPISTPKINTSSYLHITVEGIVVLADITPYLDPKKDYLFRGVFDPYGDEDFILSLPRIKLHTALCPEVSKNIMKESLAKQIQELSPVLDDFFRFNNENYETTGYLGMTFIYQEKFGVVHVFTVKDELMDCDFILNSIGMDYIGMKIEGNSIKFGHPCYYR
jgi:hypothetical protein